MRVNHNNVTVTTAGTQVQIDTAADALKTITFVALPTNTGDIYIGGASVANTRGIPLAARDVLIIDFEDGEGRLSDWWVDSAVNGEGVAWLAIFKHGS